MNHTASLSDIQHITERFSSAGKRIRAERLEPVCGRPYPVVILLHGMEGLHTGRANRYTEMARYLAEHGYVVWLVHYYDSTGQPLGFFLPNPVQFMTWIQVIGDALAHASRQPQVIPDKMALVGVSLGAYLAVSAAAADTRVAAVVECFGGVPEIVAQQLTRMPPTLILHGELDPVVPVSEARKLLTLLREKGQIAECQIYPGAGHGFYGATLQDALDRTVRFLDCHLKNQAGGACRCA